VRLPLRFLLIPLIATSLSLPALAAPEQKPDASVKTKTIAASVTIDPALKAYPGLYPRLLAAGKHEMAKWRADADKDFRENPDMFRDKRSYKFERSYQQDSAIQGYVSIARTDYTDSVGAHPNHDTDTLLWDTKARKFISIRPFFKETRPHGPTMSALATIIKNAVVAEKKAHGLSAEEANDPMWLGNIKPDLTKIGAVSLARSTEHDKSAGLTVYFSPYAVGPYVEGDYTVFVPWTAFKTHLSQVGVRLFGGTRPKSDVDKDKN
jgi:hypothetical protein